MSEEILDINTEKKQPLTIFKALLWAGAFSVLIVSAVMLIFWTNLLPSEIENHIVTRYILGVIWLTPSLVALYLITAYGDRKRHFIRIITTGTLSLQFTIICMYMANILREIIDPYYFVLYTGKGFVDPLYLNLVVPVFAIIFWQNAGKLTYTRKQMEP